MGELEKPSNENARLEFVRDLAILDTPRECLLDRIVFTAAQLFRSPIALITIVDEGRQWFKASAGLPMEMTETSREIAFCAHTILSEIPLIIEDATADPRFSLNPLVVGDPCIRSYFGSPLIAPGHLLLGSLCVIDTLPKSPPAERIAVLRQLAAKATKIICNRILVMER